MDSEPTELTELSEIDELCALIGNIIRLTVAVETHAARAAADAAAARTLHADLFQPRLSPSGRKDDMVNHMLLRAFVTFRYELELIQMLSTAGVPEDEQS